MTGPASEKDRDKGVIVDPRHRLELTPGVDAATVTFVVIEVWRTFGAVVDALIEVSRCE